MPVAEVIKYNGGSDVFAWKFPNEELSTWSQLIVNESQEAVLLKGGQLYDVFGPGRHILDTGNIPLLRHIVNLPSGGQSPFTAEVWYINKVHSLNIKWGTATPVQVQDPKYKVFLPLRAFGQFGIQVIEPTMFLTKLVGTMPVFDKNHLEIFFRGLYLTIVKDALASYLVKQSISALEINAYLRDLSAHLQENLSPVLAEYGVSLLNFFVNNISVPDDNPSIVQLKAALAKRAEMDIVGYSYEQERSFDTMEGVDPGAAQPSVMGFGAPKQCPGCGEHIKSDKVKFCPECGNSLRKKCTGCNTVIEGNPKFCLECGNKL